MWRSLVAYTPGGRGVAGSNPVISTNGTGNICVVGFFMLRNHMGTTIKQYLYICGSLRFSYIN